MSRPIGDRPQRYRIGDQGFGLDHGTQTQVDIQDLAAGCYTVQLQWADRTFARELIKVKE